MQITPLEQKNYTAAVIQPGKKINSACVLTCCQIWMEAFFDKKWAQDDFFSTLYSRNIIRGDAYINNYDEIFRVCKPILAISGPKWAFIDDQKEINKLIDAGKNPLLFLGGHCVIADRRLSASDTRLYVLDPYDGERKILTRPIKRAGVWL